MKDELKDIKAVGFDLDNTLYKQTPEVNDIIQSYIWQKASMVTGKKRDEFERLFKELQSARRALIELGYGDNDKSAALVQEGLENADVASYLQKDEQLVNIMDRLAGKFTLYLITTSSESQSIKKLAALGIPIENFEHRYYAGYPFKRDDGEIFRHISEKELDNMPLEYMMFVGDREKVDILPAKKLGMRTAIVNVPDDELEKSQADYKLKSIYELEDILL